MNETIFRFLNSFALQHPVIDAMVVFFASIFGWLLVAGVIYVFTTERIKTLGNLSYTITPKLITSYKKELAVVLLTALSAWIFALILKFFAYSPRPFIALQDVNLLFIKGDTDSFPSGHVTFFSALTVALYFYHRRMAHWYFVGALIIGISRVIAGVHWPFDVVGGYILGGVIAYSVYYFYSKKQNPT